MYANTLLSLFGFFSLLLTLTACDPAQPVNPPAVVCHVTSATEQIPQDSPPTLTLQRSFTYTNGQLTAIREQSATQQAAYQLTYQDKQVMQVTGNPVAIALERDPKTGLISRATMTKNGQTQSVFTMTYTAANRLSTLTETRQVLVAGSSVVGRTYSFSYTSSDNVATEGVRFTFQNGSILDQETTYTAGQALSPYASFPELTLLTLVSVGQQFEAHPGRLWQYRAVAGYQTFTLDGTNRLLAESATFTDQTDASGNLTARTQTTKYYIPAGSTFASTKPTSHTFAYECR